MKSSDLNLEPGVIFDWDIDEILTRQSCDVGGYSCIVCTKCGATNFDSWGWYRDGEFLDHRDDATLDHSCYDHADDAPIQDAWDACLETKRQDDHYPDIVDSIRAFGFIRPLTARLVDSNLEFGDGHHRLAAAIDLGLTTVPVKVFRDWAVAKDSGSWYTEDPIPTESEVVYR
jgi:hypothetical protein